MSFTAVNLPLPILLHSLSLTGLGLTLLLRPHRSPFSFLTCREIFASNISLPSSSSSAKPADSATTASASDARPSPRRVIHTTAHAGAAVTAVGLCYLATSYMPIEENQFLHATVPIRVVIVALLLSTLVLRGGEMSTEGWWEYLGLVVWDGIGAVGLGLYLGSWDSRIPAR